MTDRKPAEVFHPGKLIREEMEERGWTAHELASRLMWASWDLDAVLAGRRNITSLSARDLATVFGVPVEFWQNLQEAHDDAMTPGRSG
jgi:addiction module HigA family antidote